MSINGGASAFTTNGVYNLIGYSGSISGTGVSALTVGSSSSNTATNNYTFGASGSFVTLAVTSSGGTIDYYNKDADGNWGTPANWTAGVPNAVGAFASFGGGGTPITAPRTVTVDGSYTVGTLAFNSANSFTLAAGAGANLTLDNGTGAAFITDTGGSHTIAAPVTLTTNGATITVASSADILNMSGVVGGTGAGLTKAGLGTLTLGSANTYTGGTNLNLGKLVIGSDGSLGDASGGLTFGGGTLSLTNDVTSARSMGVSTTADATVDTAGHALTLSGNISPVAGGTGGLTKIGNGTLVLSGTNSYVGATNISAGALSISANANLGDATSGSSLFLGGGTTLLTTANFTLDNAGANQRLVTLGAGGVTFNTASGTTVVVDGGLTGAGLLTKVGTGQLTVTTPTNGANGITGGTLVKEGIILLGDTTATGNGLGTGVVTLDGGTLSLRPSNAIPNATAAPFPNNVIVDTGFTGGLITNARGSVTGTLTGGGTLNIQTDYVRSQFDMNFSAFTGQINITPNTNGGDFRLNSTTGFGTAAVNIASGATVYDLVVFGAGGLTESIGELSGTGFLRGGPTAGRVLTYSVGSRNTNSSFDGVIADGVAAGVATGPTAITKVGTGTLALTGANTYTGVTTINGGILNINGINALGGANYAGLTFGGGTLQYTAAVTNGGTDITNIGAAKAVILNTGGGTIDPNGNTLDYISPISGVGGLTLADSNAVKGTLTLDSDETYTGLTTVAAGNVLNVNGTLAAIGALTTSGTVNFAPNTSSGTIFQRAKSLITIKSGGLVNLTAGAQATRTSLTASGLTIAGATDAWTGKLDLANNDAVVQAGNLATLTNQVKQGFSGGSWQGSGGIVSTIAAADTKHLTALGVIPNTADGSTPLYANFDGALTANSATDVLIKYTYYGDADLSGVVDATDYSRIDNGFMSQSTATPLSGWFNGDFNYDGVINGSDYTLIDNAFNTQGATLAAIIASPLAGSAAQIAAGSAAVPEPTTLGLIGIGAASLLGRRRRRN